MRSNGISIILAFPILVLLQGCVSIPKDGGFDNVAKAIELRTDLNISRKTPSLEKGIQEILNKPLSADTAVQVTLYNNQNIQALLEELGISSADIAQAALAGNPVISARARFPEESHLKTNTEFSIEQNFMDIILAPLKSRLAQEQFKQAQLDVSEKIYAFSLETKEAYYKLQGTRQINLMYNNLLKTASSAFELARRQREAGNISELDLANEKAMYYQVKLDLARSDSEVKALEENLNRLMGFGGRDLSWTMSDELPKMQEEEPSIDELVALAIDQRLDLAAARQQVEIHKKSLPLSRFNALKKLNIGVDTEKETDGARVTGPSAEVGVPVFDRGQLAAHKAKAQLRQSEHHLAAMENEARSDVRLAYGRLLAMREIVDTYRNDIVPARAEVVDLSQKNYNFMLLGVYALLQVKQNEINAYREYVESLRDYWIARAHLERAIGGKIPLKK